MVRVWIIKTICKSDKTEKIMNSKEFAVVWFIVISAAAQNNTWAANISSVNRFNDEGRLNVYLRAARIDTQGSNKLIEGLRGELPDNGHFGGTAMGAIVD
jgi:hypothetical protein